MSNVATVTWGSDWGMVLKQQCASWRHCQSLQNRADPIQGEPALGELRDVTENDGSFLEGKGMISHSDHSLLHRLSPCHPIPWVLTGWNKWQEKSFYATGSPARPADLRDITMPVATTVIMGRAWVTPESLCSGQLCLSLAMLVPACSLCSGHSLPKCLALTSRTAGFSL